jgi:hypothetical protein
MCEQTGRDQLWDMVSRASVHASQAQHYKR